MRAPLPAASSFAPILNRFIKRAQPQDDARREAITDWWSRAIDRALIEGIRAERAAEQARGRT